MEKALIYLVPALGLVGLLIMAIKSAWVTKQPTGDKNMVELSGYIADGAMAFLKAEWIAAPKPILSDESYQFEDIDRKPSLKI